MHSDSLPSTAHVDRAPDAPGRSSSSKIFGYDFFVSFKLGAPPDGAQSYASDLARGLRDLDYTVFFSEEQAAPGETLSPTLLAALHRARILVVVVTSGALRSEWVRREVQEFRARHPKRPVILVNVNRAIERFGEECNATSWLGHEGKIWLDETDEAVRAGIVGKHLFRRLALVPRFARANRRFRWLVGAVITLLSTATVVAWCLREQSHERLVAYNVSQGRSALASGRALEAAPSLLRALDEGADTPDVRFMLARAFEPIDALAAVFDAAAAVISPDGTRLALALRSGLVEVRNVPQLEVVATLSSPVPDVRALAFSADGVSLLVTAGRPPAGVRSAFSGCARPRLQ